MPAKLTPQNLSETIPPWCKAVHAYAREKGWWKEGIAERNVPQMILLIRSELIEAHEEHRKPDLKLTDIYYGEGEHPKPEGFPIEVADAAIRIFDLAEALVSITPTSEAATVISKASHAAQILVGADVADNVGEALDDLIMAISKARKTSEEALCYAGESASRVTLVGSLIEIVGELFALARSYDIDLGHAIALKHEYNLTRPFRHGNKKA
jgi:hypothetical protein